MPHLFVIFYKQSRYATTNPVIHRRRRYDHVTCRFLRSGLHVSRITRACVISDTAIYRWAVTPIWGWSH